jgi:hypothetical protein
MCSRAASELAARSSILAIAELISSAVWIPWSTRMVDRRECSPSLLCCFRESVRVHPGRPS